MGLMKGLENGRNEEEGPPACACRLAEDPGAWRPSTMHATDEEMAPRPLAEPPRPRHVLSSVIASSGRGGGRGGRVERSALGPTARSKE